MVFKMVGLQWMEFTVAEDNVSLTWNTFLQEYCQHLYYNLISRPVGS